MGANITTENIDKLKQLNDVMKSNSLIEKLEKVSNMGGFNGVKIRKDLEDCVAKLTSKKEDNTACLPLVYLWTKLLKLICPCL